MKEIKDLDFEYIHELLIAVGIICSLVVCSEGELELTNDFPEFVLAVSPCVVETAIVDVVPSKCMNFNKHFTLTIVQSIKTSGVFYCRPVNSSIND